MKDLLPSEVINIALPPIIIVITVISALIFNKLFTKFIKKSSADINNDPTNYKFLKHAITATIYLVGIGFAIYSIPKLQTIAKSMLAGAGIAAVAIGFASQQALSNVISGIFIVMFKPFRVNDRLQLQDNNLTGIVEDITLRHTVIKNFENRRIIIPNSIISNQIIINANFSDDKICKWVEMSISYESDIKKAKAIMAEEVAKHPNFIDNRTPEQIKDGEPLVPVRVLEMGEYFIKVRAWAWAVDPPSAFVLGCDLLETIKERFDKESIEIPYPYRNIVNRDEGLGLS